MEDVHDTRVLTLADENNFIGNVCSMHLAMHEQYF